MLRQIKLIRILIVLLISASGMAQNNITDDEQRIFEQDSLNVKAEYPGGNLKFYEFIGKNLRVPVEAPSGKMILKGVVGVDGQLYNITVVQNPLGKKMLREVLRLLKKCPKWTPGIHNGEAVASYVTIPIMVNNTTIFERKGY